MAALIHVYQLTKTNINAIINYVLYPKRIRQQIEKLPVLIVFKAFCKIIFDVTNLIRNVNRVLELVLAEL